MKTKLLWCFIYFLILAGIFFIVFFKVYPTNDQINRQLILYKIVDVIKYNEFEDGKISIHFKVKINEHDFEMITSSSYNNISYRHLNDDCQYCKVHKITKYNGFCFSTLDGLSTEIQQRINNIKENKVKNKDEK